MRNLRQVFLFLFFVLLYISGFQGYSQSFSDELKLKLPKTDQYKLLKAETFNTQGKTFLAKAEAISDSMKLTGKPVLEMQKEKGYSDYFAFKIKASYCFRNANGLFFGVLNKHIREFWKNHRQEKKALELILNVENAAFDSLVKGDKLRETAENKLYLEEKIPLVSQAEIIEQDALNKLEKVLFVYLNWPLQPNLAWLYSDDTLNPFKVDESKGIHLGSIIIDTDTTKKDTVQKSISLYNLMHISENDIDRFNEFLKEKHPDKMESYLIDYQKLYNSMVDTLQLEWHKYLASGIAPHDTLKTSSKIISENTRLIPTSSKSNYEVEAGNFQYKVQISASRNKISAKELRRIYPDNEKITESFEDQWFKYTIGAFQTYDNVRNFRDSVKRKVKGAFVIAYYNGKRIKITPMLIRTNKAP